MLATLFALFPITYALSQICDEKSIRISDYFIALSQKCDTLQMWTLKAFTADYRTTVVAEWYAGQDELVQAAFETRLKFLLAQPPLIWQRPYVGTLRKECKGLFEIRFEVKNVQHRPIGYYSGELEFTILAFATERGGNFDPFHVCRTAKSRKALIDRDRRYARAVTFQD
jgi:hypothetical protein